MLEGTEPTVQQTPSRRWQFPLGALFLLMVITAVALHPAFQRQLVRWGVLPNTKRLITPTFEFEGKTYIALTTAEGRLPTGVPQHLVLAYPDKQPTSPVAIVLDSKSKKPVSMRSFRTGVRAMLCDLSGDGRPELMLEPWGIDPAMGQWMHLTPKRQYEYADGTRTVEEEELDPLMIVGSREVYSLEDRARLIFHVNDGDRGQILSAGNVSSHSTFSDQWIDAYGTGRPVLCRVAKTTRTTTTSPSPEAPQRSPDTVEEETFYTFSYYAPDDDGKWELREYPEELPSEDAIQGTLGRKANPAAAPAK